MPFFSSGELWALILNSSFANARKETEQYTKSGETEPMQENLVTAAVMQHLPGQLVINFYAVALLR